MRYVKMFEVPRSKNTGRFRQEYIGSHRNMEAVFRQENFRSFSGDFRPVPCGKAQEGDRNAPEKSRNFPAGILLPCSGDFQCIPAGSSVFSISFLQVPSGSGHRNLRPGLLTCRNLNDLFEKFMTEFFVSIFWYFFLNFMCIFDFLSNFLNHS